MTYDEALKNAYVLLEKAQVPDFRHDAELLMEYAAGVDSAHLLLNREEQMSEQVRGSFERLLERRLQREPLQYILGSWEFMGLKFKCGPECLIPRQDTELLAMTAITAVRDFRTAGEVRLLDLCTGSGCVIISVKHYEERIRAFGADISSEALEAARKNAEMNGTEVDFRLSDMFGAFEKEQFDIITANPPYIETDVIEGLNPEIRVFEPRIALDGGTDGLKHYRSIAAGALDHLVSGGRLLLEIGDTQGEAVFSLLEDSGYAGVGIRKDLAGLDRVVTAYKP